MTVNEIVTQRILDKLNQGEIPWRKPWSAAHAGVGEHRNLLSGKPYRGINALLTAMQGYSSPNWLTYKQAQAMGAQVRKGEKGTPIVYVGRVEKDNGTDSPDSFAFLRYYTAFNAEQIDGLPTQPVPDTPRPFEPITACEEILKTQPMAKLTLHHGGNRAYYHPLHDAVQMPPKESFTSPSGYYAVLFHELGHASGHSSRLAREGITESHGFGTHAYSKEELVAELTSAFLCQRTGIDTMTLENAAAYIQGWVRVLKNDHKFIISAAAQAQKAFDYLTNKTLDS